MTEMIDDRTVPLRARALLIVVAVVALVLVASSDAVHAAVLRVFEGSTDVIARNPLIGRVVFVGLAAISAMLAFFSSSVLVPTAVLAWGTLQTALLLWAGWWLGGLVAYTLARSLGRPALRWLTPAQTLAKYEERLRRGTPFGLILLFQLALPSEIPGYVLGLARYPLSRYLAALALAELPYAVGTMLLGASFLERRVGLLLSVGAAALVGVIVLAWTLRRRLA